LEANMVPPPEKFIDGLAIPIELATVEGTVFVLGHCGGRCCMGTSTGCDWAFQAVAVVAFEGDDVVGHMLVGRLDWVCP
jgi:hypothetical protein